MSLENGWCSLCSPEGTIAQEPRVWCNIRLILCAALGGDSLQLQDGCLLKGPSHAALLCR